MHKFVVVVKRTVFLVLDGADNEKAVDFFWEQFRELYLTIIIRSSSQIPSKFFDFMFFIMRIQAGSG